MSWWDVFLGIILSVDILDVLGLGPVVVVSG